MKNLSAFLLLLFISLSTVYGQLYEVGLPIKIEKSTLIVEGEVLKSESYWDKRHKNIYTSHLVKVSSLFKGEVESAEIEVITSGGWVGDEGVEIPPIFEISGRRIWFVFWSNFLFTLKIWG